MIILRIIQILIPIQFSKIEQLSLEDLSGEIQEEIADKKVMRKKLKFLKMIITFFFIVCEISGDEFQEIDENMIDNKLYYEKVQQLSQTYLKRLNRNSNIKNYSLIKLCKKKTNLYYNG